MDEAFRIAEDRILADLDDDTLSLPDAAMVGIAHPLCLGAALDTWSQVFTDYEILQPFPQLGRSVHTLTDDERSKAFCHTTALGSRQADDRGGMVRRWEFVGDGSAKFWEVNRDGVVVTVRFGRLRTSGRTRTKELASESAATSYVDRLIAEKEGKGYRAVADTPQATSAAARREPSTETPELPDEDAFVIPPSWFRYIHPRRGGASGTKITVSTDTATAVQSVVDSLRDIVETVLTDPRSDSALVKEARGYLGGERTTLGAATIAAVVSSTPPWNRTDQLAQFADAWIARHGLVFAATATAELSDVVIEWTAYGRDRSERHVRFRQAGEPLGANWLGQQLAHRVRAFLAVAEDQDYLSAVDALRKCRRNEFQRVVTSFLVPTEQAWVDECCAEAASQWDARRFLLPCALGSVDQLKVFRTNTVGVPNFTRILYTLAEGVGTAVAPVLAELLDGDPAGSDSRKTLLDILGTLPTDEAFELMVTRADQKHVQPALIRMMKRYPVRALRVLATTASGTTKNASVAAQLLTGHVLTHQALVTAVLPTLTTELRTVVDSVLASTERIEEASEDTLPGLLVDPPWTGKRVAAKPMVVNGLVPPAEHTFAWAPGERQEWREAYVYWTSPWQQDTDWDDAIKSYWTGKLPGYSKFSLFMEGPEHLVRPLLPSWRWSDLNTTKRVVARHEQHALPVALQTARANPSSSAVVLLPFASIEVAELMADLLVRLKSARSVALAWFARHRAVAARLLVPAALGKPGKARRNAEAALRVIATTGEASDVVDIARDYGEPVASAVETLLAADPMEILPARMPVVGDWADTALLPQVLLRGRDTALPITSVKHLVTMLALSKPDDVYPGVDVVREVCDPESLAEFGWALFQRWQAAGTPAKDNWALTALGLLGNDHTVRQLTPIIRAWPGEGGHARAVAGLDVLAAIGTDVALMHLHGISQKVKFKALKTRAQEKIAEVAAALDLTAEQLADRLVPDLGLDHDGSLTLDYGQRKFVVGFDEHLKPHVSDEHGKRLKNLSKPGIRDDQELAPTAYKQFTALKKDVRTVAADQIKRLEHAMVAQRRWTTTEFHNLFANHPLLWHIARRLVWTTEGEAFPADPLKPREGTAFRIAEDRTLADIEDNALTLADSVEVCIAYPLHLGDALDSWSEVFADYEILQPFPQLGRPVHALTDDERAGTSLTRFQGIAVPTGKVLGLQRRGWQRGQPQDAGIEPWILKPIPGNSAIVINLDPGIAVGAMDIFPEHRIEHLWINSRPDGDWSPTKNLTFGELDQVTASELLADLTELTT